MANTYSLALHGGSGTHEEAAMSAEQRSAIHQALRYALNEGERILENDGSALDAVEATVVALEEAPYFNAGHGACMTWEGHHELDASIMDGRDLSAGAVAGIRNTRSPVRAARAVMTQSRHILLGGEGADRFAKEIGLECVDNDYFTTPLRRQHWETLQGKQDDSADLFRLGTVGAVARDRHGNLAAATSTGGITNKRWGRIGDSPIIGAGNYADNRSCAVSCTGEGELFIRHSVAHEIAARLRLTGQMLDAAIRELLDGPLAAEGGTGGIIAIDAEGNMVLDFNTRGMYRAWRQEGDEAWSAIESQAHAY